MSSIYKKVRYEELRSLDFASIGATYTAVGSSFSHSVRQLKVNNLTDVNLLISFDGATDHDIVAANSAYILDYSSNNEMPGGQFEHPVGETLYVKEQSAPVGSGNVYVTVIYAAKS
jgi:hypothetical protein